jgi:hypothetical protein
VFLTRPPPRAVSPEVSDPDLVRIISTWSTLPEPIRRAVLALVESVFPLTMRLPQNHEP